MAPRNLKHLISYLRFYITLLINDLTKCCFYNFIDISLNVKCLSSYFCFCSLHVKIFDSE